MGREEEWLLFSGWLVDEEDEERLYLKNMFWQESLLHNGVVLLTTEWLEKQQQQAAQEVELAAGWMWDTQYIWYQYGGSLANCRKQIDEWNCRNEWMNAAWNPFRIFILHLSIEFRDIPSSEWNEWMKWTNAWKEEGREIEELFIKSERVLIVWII